MFTSYLVTGATKKVTWKPIKLDLLPTDIGNILFAAFWDIIMYDCAACLSRGHTFDGYKIRSK